MKTNHKLKQSGLFRLLFIILALMILTACGPSDETNNDSDPEEQPVATQADGAYPAADDSVSAYPGVTTSHPVADSAYPDDVDEDLVGRFAIDQPLQPGATTVTGQAPPELLVAVVDVTFGGVLLGTGRADSEGNFSITVTPLPETHRIGLTFAESPEGKSFEEMSTELFPYRGDGFMNVPNVGIFFASAMTQSQ